MAEAGAEEAPAATEDLAPAPAASSGSAAGSWPDFAVVCSFLERYGAALDLPEITFPELEEALEESGAVSRVLVELHMKLMRKIGKSVTFDRWEKYLIRICQDYNSTWAWEMEKKGYQEMDVECKVGMLKHLCECQFDDNLKFKNAINEEEADTMRVQPIGRDKDGLMYWYQLDQDHNIRVYIEEQDDQDGSSWKCIVRSRNDLAQIVELLKTQIDPALLKKPEPEENSSQNPNPDDDVKKEEGGEKSLENDEIKEEKPDVVNKETSDSPTENGSGCETVGETPLKTSSEIKTEPSSDTEEGKPTAKERDSFKENIKPVKAESKAEKTEPKDLKELKGISEKTPSPQDPERAEVSVIVKRAEEHMEKPVEDTEKMKNDQQAKIPLKKRELKLTDDFDSPVKAAICKSKTPTKELLQKEEGKPEDDGTKAAADGKQLVNGEVTSEKVHKTKGDHQVEDGAAAPRETVIECAKDENGIANEKRNSSVIKSLQELKDNGKTKMLDGLEKGVTDVSNDRSTPPVQESSSKPASVVEMAEEDPGKCTTVSKVDDEKEKTPPEEKESTKDAETIKESDEPAKEVLPCEEGSQTADQRVTDKKGEDLKDEDSRECESKVKDGKSKATKVKLSVAKKSSTRNAAARKEKPSEDPEKADNDVKEKPASTEKAETDEKEPVKEKKTFTLRSKSRTIERKAPQSKDVQEEKVEEVADQEKIPEKPSQTSRSKNKQKAAAEEENSGSEGKEMTSERQKDGLKLTIRISNKKRMPELPVEDAEDVDAEENIGRRLRRSPRISRPSVKISEVKPRKPEKKQSDDEESPARVKPEREEEKKSEKESSQKTKRKPRLGRRTRWTLTRSRRKRKSSTEEETEESDSEEDSEEGSEDEKEKGAPGEDDEPCKKCGLPNHPELILLCDSCDSGYHTACLRPPLMIIPDGEWFCPPCQHKLLCEKLEEQLQNLDVVLKKKERAVRRKERLVYVGISIENIIPAQETEEVPEIQEKEEKKKKKPKPMERRSTRARKFISYRFDEFDEAIDEAIEHDIRDADGGGGGGGRGKDMSNITGHRGKDISTILEGEREEGKRPQRAVTRRKKRRRLNDLDSDSNMDEEESEDEFRISEGSQDEFVVSDENIEESDEDQQSNDSDFGARRPRRHYRRPMRQSRRIKRRSVRRRYSEDDDDDESGDDSQGSETDDSSEYSDDYLDTRRRRSRRNQKRQVNYKEDSESDNSQKRARHGRGKEMRRILKRRCSSSESNESDFSVASDNKPRNARKNLLRKRIRSSNDELSDEEKEKPVRKRLNRIETDDEDEEEGDAKVCSSSDKPPASAEDKPPASAEDKPPASAEDKPPAATAVPEGTKKPSYRIESDDEDDFENVTKDGSPLDYSLVDLPSANGQSPGKTIETLIGKSSEKSETTKDTSAPVSQASNGTGGGQEAAGAEEDEDELLRVTDLVDYVCNSEQL